MAGITPPIVNTGGNEQRSVTMTARPESLHLDPQETAVIVIDMQNAYASKGGYVDLSSLSGDVTDLIPTISKIGTVLSTARSASIPVIFLQNGWDSEYVEAGTPLSPNWHKSNALKTMRAKPELNGKLLARGSWDYELVDALKPQPGDISVNKTRYSAFFNSQLDSVLRARRIKNLVFVGIATNVCVESTLRDGFHLEYFCTMLEDAVSPIGGQAMQDATVFNVEKFFGWVSSSEDFCEAFGIPQNNIQQKTEVTAPTETNMQPEDVSQSGIDSEAETAAHSGEWERVDSPVIDAIDKPLIQQLRSGTPKLTSLNGNANLSLDRERLMADIHHTAQFGAGKRWGPSPTDIGMARLSLSDSDKDVRDWFIQTAKSYDCKVHVDEIGNIFAIRPGRQEGPPTMMGSHLDTQPAGGRYDGILGVLAGLAAIRTLHEQGLETEFPVGVVNWTNEEGARFPQCMMASGVWAGATNVEDVHKIADITDANTTVKSELTRIGYLGETKADWRATPFAAHFELHIEQGPILEASNQCIGAVQGVQASKWFTITVTGRDSHTGATNFENRSDALLTSAKMILRSHQVATQFSSLASTGLLSIDPGSTNTVPGVVTFSLDLRSTKDENMVKMEEMLRGDFEKIANDAGEEVGTVNLGCTQGKGCTVSWRVDSNAKVAQFDEECIQCIEKGSEALFAEKATSLTRRMYSGAGHDSVHTSTRIPTAMIFVPCREGLTHNPAEFCSPEDCGNGAQVLLNAVLGYDKLRGLRSQA